MKSQPTLTTERLLLSPLRAADIPLIIAYAGNPNIARYTQYIPYPYQEADAIYWLNLANIGYKNGTHHVFAIRNPENEAFMGGMGLTVNQAHNKASVGYWLAEQFWGEGYCTEALRAVLRYGLEEVGLNKINASYLAVNGASGRVMEKAGMIKEGVQRKDMLKNGVYHDHVCYGMLASDT